MVAALGKKVPISIRGADWLVCSAIIIDLYRRWRGVYHVGSRREAIRISYGPTADWHCRVMHHGDAVARYDAMRNVIVLGSGRSGTSMTAGLLAQSGYFMGKRPNPSRVGNPKGQFEDGEINELNEAILAPVSGSMGRGRGWLARVPVNAAIPKSSKLEARVEAMTRQVPFCFKDPRFSYTLPIWEPYLTDTVFVCVFRDPASTALSMLRQASRVEHLQGFPLSFGEAVDVWTLMYRHILEKHRRRGDWLFVHFNQLLEQAGQKRLAAFAQARVDPTFPEPELRRSYCDRAVPLEPQSVYRQLCELAGYDLRTENLAAKAQPPPNFRVSVVITSYNQKPYLVEAVESVICQTLKPHEIIIADDGSSDHDGSAACIRDYVARYPGWVKGVFQKANVGIPANRNAGLKEVTGNYVAILDGDDCFFPDKIEQEWAVLQQHPEAACIYSNVQMIDRSGRPIGVRDAEDQPSGDVFAAIAAGMFGLLRSMLINCEVLKKVGGLDHRFPKYDGFDLTVRLAKEGPFAYVPAPLVKYRVHPEGDSRSLGIQEHFSDLQGIFAKMSPLLDDIPEEVRRKIKQAHENIFLNILKRYLKTRCLFKEISEIAGVAHPLLMPILEEMARQNVQIEQQRKHLFDQRERLKAKMTQIAEQRRQLLKKSDQIRQHQRMLQEKISRINELDAQSARLRRANRRLERDLQVMLSSRSWKLTAPLRKGFRYIRGLRQFKCKP
jgi:GT2 family glycosyltransferase